MNEFTINCFYNNNECEEELVWDYKEQNQVLEIRCDNVQDNNSFIMEYYGDEGILITRNRCKLNIHLTENKTYYDRNYTIICTHANNAEVFVQINITQEAEKFALNVKIEEWTADTQYYEGDRVFYYGSIWRCKVDNKAAKFNADNFEKDDTVTLQSIVDSSNSSKYSGSKMYYEKQTINLNIVGGSKKYRVVGIYKCYDDEEDDTVHRTTFDNGFILKKNTNSIVIRNYGRPFIDEKYYYIIVLEHFDVRDIKKEIIIKYTSLENSTITKKLRKNVGLKSSKPKIIMPIIQEEKQEKEDIVEIKPIEYGLEMLENVEDYTIIGEPVETILPFTVTEDGIESNLMVKASSSAYWCRVKVIQEYNDNDEIERKLIFRITNKPLIIRKTRITVSIIDLPDVNVSFIITNKPS